MTYPVVEFAKNDPLQHYYIDNDGNYYSVARLVDECKDLEPFDMPLAGMDLDYEPWKGANLFELAAHVKRVMDADLDEPIILDWNGCLADGRHRLIKALTEGRDTIKVVRLPWKLSPCKAAS